MSSVLGNEMPIPFSVISESYINRILNIKQELKSKNKSRYDATQEDLFECELLGALSKLIDIDCDHTICYIDCTADLKSNGEWIELLQKKFCLMRPIFYVCCELLNDNCKDEILAKLEKCPCKDFDIIIIKNCIQHIKSPESFIETVFENYCQAKDSASVVVVQRLFKTNLPFYDLVYKVWSENDFNIESFIKTLSLQNFDVNCRIEQLECDLSKMKWLFSMAKKSIYPLNCIKHDDARSSNEGVREICEGMFKYNDDRSTYVFRDCLAFLTVKRSENYFKLKNFRKNPYQKIMLASKSPYDIFDSIFDLNSSLRKKLS
jgi:hypothetical protein